MRIHQYLKWDALKCSSSRNTVVHQHTRTVKVPRDLHRGNSYVSFKPQDLLFSRVQGAFPMTSAGRTTLIVSPVVNDPTIGSIGTLCHKEPPYHKLRLCLEFYAAHACRIGHKIRNRNKRAQSCVKMNKVQIAQEHLLFSCARLLQCHSKSTYRDV